MVYKYISCGIYSPSMADASCGNESTELVQISDRDCLLGGCFGDFLAVTVTPETLKSDGIMCQILPGNTSERKTGECCQEEGTSGILNLTTTTGA